MGGFATVPPNYWALRRRLQQRGAQRVDIAPLWTPDWLLAGMLGFGGVLRRTGKAIAQTYRRAGRRPILVVGHSGGGIAARLAMSPVAFHGRVAAVADAVGCLVTLGTPHGLATLPNRYRHAGHAAAAFLDRETPGAYFAPRTGYVSVAGSRGAPLLGTGPAGGVVHEVFKMLVGDATADNGDGIVPLSAAHLEGARQITLEGVRHGMIGSPWLGDDAAIDAWWPVALDEWQRALDARRPGGAGQKGAEALELEVAGWSSGSSSGS